MIANPNSQTSQPVEDNNTAGSFLRDGPTRNKAFLVLVNIQQVMINDQPENLVFLKDVSFGVLYE